MQTVQTHDGSVSSWIPTLLEQVSSNFEVVEPTDVLAWSAETFGEGLTIGTAFGASGMALIDIARRIVPNLDVFYIDTGVFFPETYELIDRAQEHFGFEFRKVVPELTVSEQNTAYGDALWARDSDKCCFMRKVLPLSQALEGRTAWVTALRRDQSHARRSTPIVQWNKKRGLVKIAPLANWTEKDVWSHIMANDIPYNPLHDRGYPSIGCRPCTRAVKHGEDMRAGRWAGSEKTECGLHL